MKKFIIIGLVIILLIIIFVVIFFLNKDKISNISEINTFNYSYSVGNYYEARVEYNLVCNDKCILSFKDKGISIDDANEYVVDKKIVDELSYILNKYKVGYWNGFNKSDKRVMDGGSFSLYLKMNNNKSVSARGYMKWPKNYSNVKEELIILFSKYMK